MHLGQCLLCKKEFKKRYSQKKFCSLLCANRHNLNGLNQISLPKNSLALAEFVGIMLGDGHVSKYFVGISLNSIADAEYIKYVAGLSKKLFPEAPISIMPKKTQNCTSIQISSRIIADFLKSMDLMPRKKKVASWILENESYTKACTKGLIDTEGSISFKIYKSRRGISVYKQLNFRNYNQNLMHFVRDTLQTLGMRPTKTLKHSLYLSDHEGIERYGQIIGFGNKKLLERSLVVDYTSYQKWRGTEVAITGRS